MKEIYNYINEKYRIDNKIVLQIPIFKTSDSKDELFLCQILGYLQGENDKREKIMLDEQYDLMISYVQSYINTNQIPKISVKINSLKIPKNLLRFTFYLLHQKICPTIPKKEFVNFLKNLFIDFETNKSLYKKFASVDGITINRVKFIPEIIKEEVKNKREK